MNNYICHPHTPSTSLKCNCYDDTNLVGKAGKHQAEAGKHQAEAGTLVARVTGYMEASDLCNTSKEPYSYYNYYN